MNPYNPFGSTIRSEIVGMPEVIGQTSPFELVVAHFHKDYWIQMPR